MIISDAKVIEIDRYFDYIPLISTLSNSFLIFQKCMTYCFFKETIGQSRYFQLTKDKPLLRRVTVLFPFIGNLVIALYDFIAYRFEAKRELEDKKLPVREEGELRNNINPELCVDASPEEIIPITEVPKEKVLPAPGPAVSEIDKIVIKEDEVEGHKKAAQNGNVDSMLFLAAFYQKENMDVEEFEWLQKAADAGHIVSCREVALKFQYGKGVRLNVKKAFKYYRKSALQGDVLSMVNLANMYFCYESYKDLDKAVKWYTKASKCNDSFAISWLVNFKILQDLEGRAEKNEAEAMFQLARFYEVTPGFEDEDESWEWMNKAGELDHLEALKELAASDDTDAMYKLGRINAKGLNGVSKSPEEAFKWYLKGAELDNVDCMEKLSSCYKKGKGVAQDESAARHWHLMALMQ